jgi:hypothetical protein
MPKAATSNLWDYINETFRQWGKSISGPVFGIVSIASSAVSAKALDNPWLARQNTLIAAILFGILSVGFFLAAQYKVWLHSQQARLKAEEELNSEADIRGMIHVGIMQYDPSNESLSGHNSGILVSCDCSNHGRKTCQISKILVLIDTPGEKQYRFLQQMAPGDVKDVEHGHQYLAAFDIKLYGIQITRLRKSLLILHLLDSLGTEYQHTQTLITILVPNLGFRQEHS